MVLEQRSTFLDDLLLRYILPSLHASGLHRHLPIRNFWNKRISRDPATSTALSERQILRRPLALERRAA
ncbi:MAG: hypothetical protein HY329_03010 [Chloroflexi bacterium]|nr:hypothetical protein [Chloroflexota bacterium]